MSLERVTLLCVEDDVTTLDALQTLLEDEVKMLFLAADGDEGLDLFKARRPDIVLTDIEMPRKNGIEMAREIKEIDPHALIAILTAYDSKKYLEQAANLGVNKYIYKPIVAESLFSALEQMADIVQKTKREKTWLSIDGRNLAGSVDPIAVALDGADGGFFDWNTATDALVRNTVFDRTFRFTEENSPQTFSEWTDRWYPDDKTIMLNELKSYVQSYRDISFHRRLRMLGASGDWVSVSFQGKSYIDDDGKLHFAGIVEDITRQSEQEQAVFDRSKYDIATVVALSYAAFSEALTRKMTDTHLFLCFICVDETDRIHRSLGPTRLNRVLKTTAQRIDTFRREGDLLGRVRQDSFGLTITCEDRFDLPSRLLTEVVEKITEPIDCYGRKVTIKTNIGITRYSMGSDKSADEAIHEAMLAMYENKTQSEHYFYAVRDDTQPKEVEMLLQRFDDAIENDELQLVYQPKVFMSTGALAGLEALVRWRHPERGLLTPDAFLPIVESDSRIMHKLGEWVFGSAFDQLSGWKRQGFNTSISLNVSALEFEDDGVLSRLQSMFQTHPDIDPSAIEIEVLETQAVKKIEEFLVQLRSCRELGVWVAIDDFGTGYASLDYLKRFPWNTLKIDQSFVKHILLDSRSASIVELSVKLARSFDSTVIAEGVEDEACGVALQRFGCDLAQGYAISRPLPPEDVSEWRNSWEAFPSWRSSSLQL